MEARMRVLSLYKRMLRESYKFSAYNHRWNHFRMNLFVVAAADLEIRSPRFAYITCGCVAKK